MTHEAQIQDDNTPLFKNELRTLIKNTRFSSLPRRTPVICNDGFRLSVQASEFHYCFPQRTGLDSYTHYELSLVDSDVQISQDELDLLEEYSEGFDDSIVYLRVPSDIVEQIIKNHGGIIGLLVIDENERQAIKQHLINVLRG